MSPTMPFTNLEDDLHTHFRKVCILSIFDGNCVSSFLYLAPMEALGGDKSLIL